VFDNPSIIIRYWKNAPFTVICQGKHNPVTDNILPFQSGMPLTT